MKLGSLLNSCQTEGVCVCVLSVACSAEQSSLIDNFIFIIALDSLLVVGQDAIGQYLSGYHMHLTNSSHQAHKNQEINNLICIRYCNLKLLKQSKHR